MATPLINGKAYDWSMIVVTMLGVPFTGITAVSYKTSQEKTNNYGIGSEPVSRGRGRKTYEASITFLGEEWKNILSAAPDNDPLKIGSFDVSIKFLDPVSGLIQETLMKFCEFTEHGVDASEGDTMIEVEAPILPGSIVTQNIV